MEKNRKHNIGIFCLILAALFWSFNGLLIKSVRWSAFSLLTVRGILTFLIFLCMRGKGERFTFSLPVIIGAVCYFGQAALLVAANKLTTAGNAAALQYVSPVFIILLNLIIYRKKPGIPDLLACLFMVAGVALCFADSFGQGTFAGNLLALASGLFYAGVFFVNERKDARPFDSLILGNALFVLLIPFLISDRAVVFHSSVKELFLVFAFCLLSGVGAWALFSRGIRTTPALSANFASMLEPVLSPLWPFLFIGERMGTKALLGCALVILTLVIYNTVGKKTKA